MQCFAITNIDGADFTVCAKLADFCQQSFQTRLVPGNEGEINARTSVFTSKRLPYAATGTGQHDDLLCFACHSCLSHEG